MYVIHTTTTTPNKKIPINNQLTRVVSTPRLGVRKRRLRVYRRRTRRPRPCGSSRQITRVVSTSFARDTCTRTVMIVTVDLYAAAVVLINFLYACRMYHSPPTPSHPTNLHAPRRRFSCLGNAERSSRIRPLAVCYRSRLR